MGRLFQTGKGNSILARDSKPNCRACGGKGYYLGQMRDQEGAKLVRVDPCPYCLKVVK